MCGIAGFWMSKDDVSNPKKTPKNQSTLNKILKKINHRGPDDLGYAEQVGKEATVALGHTRLSIIDLTYGHQPFIDEKRKIHAVCNGEIYNHGLIRKQFRDGYSFKTASDCEIILPLHQKDGKRAIESLDGMFAFLLSDGKSIYAGRDPIGIKPLYYGYRDEGMMFASEAKSLDGIVEEIHAFPSGHYFHPEEGFVSYYKIPDPDESTWLTDEEEILGRIRVGLEKSVQKRLKSDVTVGIFLYGGLDSYLVAALARKHRENLLTFSVGMEGSADLRAAREVAEYLGTIHHEI